MKKIHLAIVATFLIIFWGSAIKCVAQTIPAIKSTVTKTTSTITFVDGVVITLEGSNTIATRKAAYLKAVKPVTYDYTKTYRYGLATYAYKFSQLKPGVYTSIPAAKGGIPMIYSGATPPTLGMPNITKEGLLLLQNQANTQYRANIKGDGDHADYANAVYPREVWMVLYKPDYFVWEKFTDGDFYMGDLGDKDTGIRFTNDAAVPIFNSKIPVDQYSVWRVRLTSPKVDVANVEFWLNGIKQSSTGQVQTYFRKYYCVALGTSDNNEYVGFAEIFHTPLLSDTDAAKITNEITTEYSIGKPNALPYATILPLTYSGANKTVSYKYNGALPQGRVDIRWIDMQGKGPQGSIYRTDLDGKTTVPANFQGTVQVTVYDTAGNYFSIPSNKYFKN